MLLGAAPAAGELEQRAEAILTRELLADVRDRVHRFPLMNTHWFASGQLTSSHAPAGDHSTSPNVPGPANRSRA